MVKSIIKLEIIGNVEPCKIARREKETVNISPQCTDITLRDQQI